MYELTKTKVDRAEEVLESLLELVPSSQRLMLTAFLPQFRHSFKSVTEEQIDQLIGAVEEKIKYIREG